MTTPLKDARIKANLSQSELSSLSGINLRTLQDYEQGRRVLKKATVETVLRLSTALNVPIESLLERGV